MKKFLFLLGTVFLSAELFGAQATINLPTTGTLSGTALVTDVNAANNAMATMQSGTSDPSSYATAYTYWKDTSAGYLKERNSGNTAWTIVAPLQQRLATQAETQNASNLSSGQVSVGLLPSSFVPAKASTLSQSGGGGAPMTFYWSGQGGQPTWLWGGNDGASMYVYNPLNFSVNYASSAGTAGSASNQAVGSTGNPGYTNLNAGSGLKIRYGTTAIGDIAGSTDRVVTVGLGILAVTNVIGVYISANDSNGTHASFVCNVNTWTNSSFVIRCGELTSAVQNITVSWMVLGN